MTVSIVLAVPSMGGGGLDAERSGHFGHCECFTLVDIVDGEVTGVRIVENPPHEHGGCLRPVGLLSSHGVQALIVAGMGARPLAGFDAAGIAVFFDNSLPKVGDAVQLVIDGTAIMMDASRVCGGH